MNVCKSKKYLKGAFEDGKSDSIFRNSRGNSCIVAII